MEAVNLKKKINSLPRGNRRDIQALQDILGNLIHID
jgi:hypothetical protein